MQHSVARGRGGGNGDKGWGGGYGIFICGLSRPCCAELCTNMQHRPTFVCGQAWSAHIMPSPAGLGRGPSGTAQKTSC
jgi:hypothetical protein